MHCRVNELKRKYVINVRNGSKLGTAADVEIDTATSMVTAIVIRGRLRLWGLLGREEDIVVPWQNIEVIGEDTILVNHDLPEGEHTRASGKFFQFLSED